MTIKSRIRLLALLLSSCFVVSACESSVMHQSQAQTVAQVGSVGSHYMAALRESKQAPTTYQDSEILPKLSTREDFYRAAVITSRILSGFEYNKQPLDEEMAGRIFDAYFDALDPQRMFLLQSDIERFRPQRLNTAAMIADGELSMAFDIYTLYRERVQEHYQYIFALLDSGHQFDFTKDESFSIDRKKLPWPKSKDELHNLWRQRVKNDFLRLKLVDKTDAEILDRLRKRYTNNQKLTLQANSEDVAEMFLNAYADSTDPHTSYFSPTSAKNFNVQLSLSVEGIGAVLQKRDEYAQIREVVAGGPAAKSGQIQPGDRIVAVGQGEEGPMEDVIDWRLDDIVAKVRGERGTVVRVEILPGDEGVEAQSRIVRIVRDRVMMEDQAARVKTLEVEVEGKQRKVGVITIPSFYEDFEGRSNRQDDYKSVTRDVKKILEDLNQQDVSAVVLDLRNNGGGSLSEAANLSGLFVGPMNHIVQVKDNNDRVSHVRSNSQAMVWDKPVVVMVNRVSASASEIFAAVIQDYGRGIVVGDDTWGKGTVQTLTNLSDFIKQQMITNPEIGALKWTIQMFFRVNGASTQAKGVEPDIHFPSQFNHEEFGESSYPNALPWTQINPVKHRQFKDMQPIIKELRKLHEQRAKESGSWQLYVDETDYSVKLSERKEVSLNYEKRLQERKDMEQQRQQFNERRKALGESDVGVFRLDDGLSFGEGNLKEELEIEKRRKESIDTPTREAANIAADLVDLY
ncbi:MULTISPECIES: carboxy terminal-processing peptidase [Oligella]|uniref:Tail-specific protease n=1 Tax=Oligella urethralis TaxID=90245 RepID=A0A2X1UQX9_9BURK|nr:MULTISPECIES: carboxy terminal-processing peptidase [Oligella]SPY06891.1 Tail-specific protease precursor [Oligella urethralis]SUA59622.1 Tail-specific protease precursor [Oligella urethralis]SUA94812.1 Tail-specific protease precursor [Oligella urethralis]